MTRQHFLQDLDDTRSELIWMGSLALMALDDALTALVRSDIAAAQRVKQLEAEVDALNRTIYERCLALINLQAPVARDLRYITAILEAIVDLERVSDYADDIADVALALSGKPLPPFIDQFAAMGERTAEMLRTARESWVHLDRQTGLGVRAMDDAVDADYLRLFSNLSALLEQEPPPDSAVPLNLVLVCKFLERIADHAVNVAEQAAFAAP
ncbi:phosphate signaling complex protein PhoU [Gloeobacter kilaueensis]|uniref:Phosphate-specific transport system accessory protein PhoU n=1 Tax=Gloeobacter kilaueensis (strain ATCC BAA-2537 / CCAP 1431/1 / ULC 316 / JS1) TaxID=1183438 RepID=U5QJW8_GLOK1|nr:phosphate signaling complex protein PhoU [Gloeobacter kilaueensis]AGY59221.1 phosphate uptake regulator, PhoU [Gloeobacter kilaueensis JS1]